jgi:hypothetical protein
MVCPFEIALAQPTERAPDTIEARLRACAPCHGRQGEGTSNDYFPRLAGKPIGYLMNQLVAFRDGRRRYPPMNYLNRQLILGWRTLLLEYQSDLYLQKDRPAISQPATRIGSDSIQRIRTAAPQFGSLPQPSGICSVPFGTGDGSGGTGTEASQAATAVTSLSVRLAATAAC